MFKLALAFDKPTLKCAKMFRGINLWYCSREFQKNHSNHLWVDDVGWSAHKDPGIMNPGDKLLVMLFL
jgi:hypothetical protein